MTKKITEHEGKKYLRTIYSPDGVQAIETDVYAVIKAFSVICPARVQALKKLLCCGNRGKGSEMDDLKGAEAAISRAIELQQQDDNITKHKPKDLSGDPKLGDLIREAEIEDLSTRRGTQDSCYRG